MQTDITFFDRLRPFLSKMIAAIVVPLLAWLASKTGRMEFLDPELQHIIQGAALWLVLTVAHTLFAKKTNPGNTASAHLAKTHAVEKDEILASKTTVGEKGSI